MTLDLKTFVESLDLSSDGLRIAQVANTPDPEVVVALVEENSIRDSTSQKTETLKASEWIAIWQNTKANVIHLNMKIELGNDNDESEYFSLLVEIANEINHLSFLHISRVFINKDTDTEELTASLSFTLRISELEMAAGSTLSDATLQKIVSGRMADLYREKAVVSQNLFRVMWENEMPIEIGLPTSNALH